jgi:hypothetical protein
MPFVPVRIVNTGDQQRIVHLAEGDHYAPDPLQYRGVKADKVVSNNSGAVSDQLLQLCYVSDYVRSLSILGDPHAPYGVMSIVGFDVQIEIHSSSPP